MSSLVRAFLSSSLGTGLSRLLGLVRELAIAAAIGVGEASDAFFTAFTIPSVFRRFVADEGLTGALVPGIAKAEEQGGTEEARALAGRVLSALLLVGTVISVAGIVGAPALVSLFAAGFAAEPEKYALTVQLTRVMMPFVVAVSLVSWAEGLLNHRDHFFVPKVAPGVVSASLIVAALWPGLEDPQRIVQVLAYAVLVGGVAHVGVCLPPLVKHWGWLRPRLDWMQDPRFRSLMREMGKVAAIGVMAQINIIVLRRVASFLAEGSVSWYWNATRLVDFAQGIIAVGVGSAMLPALSRAVAGADWRSFERAFAGSARLAASLLLPTAAFILVLSEASVSVLYRRGEFTLADVGQTAACLQALVPYMLGLAATQILKKPFFALERRNALVAVGAVGVVLTASLGTWLGQRMGVVGLCWALSISTVSQALAYLLLLRRLVGPHLALRQTLTGLSRMTLACVPAAAAGWGIGQLSDWSEGATLVNLALLSGAGLVGGVLYTGTALALGVEELRAIVRRVSGRLRR